MIEGRVLAEGKTKIVYEVEGNTSLVILKNKAAITANNDPSLTREVEEKALYATTTTCSIFKLLNKKRQPTAFIEQLNATSFLCRKVTMIPLEVVVRRYADGSILKRHPEFKREDNSLHQFSPSRAELYLKTTGGQLVIGNIVIVDGLSKEADDPLIDNPFDPYWRLVHPKLPANAPNRYLGTPICAADVLHQFKSDVKDRVEEIFRIAQTAFNIIEEAWSPKGFVLIDYKIELGYTDDGSLYIADVIDNDSWRLRERSSNTDLSKEAFRQGQPLDKVMENYRRIADLSTTL